MSVVRLGYFFRISAYMALFCGWTSHWTVALAHPKNWRGAPRAC